MLDSFAWGGQEIDWLDYLISDGQEKEFNTPLYFFYSSIKF